MPKYCLKADWEMLKMYSINPKITRQKTAIKLTKGVII